MERTTPIKESRKGPSKLGGLTLVTGPQLARCPQRGPLALHPAVALPEQATGVPTSSCPHHPAPRHGRKTRR